MGKFLDAASAVLRLSEKPLTAREIVDRAISSRLLDDTHGITPVQTMRARISVDIRSKGEQSAFMRVGPGQFALRTDEHEEYQGRVFEKRLAQQDDVVVVPAGIFEKFHGFRKSPRYLKAISDPDASVLLPRLRAETDLQYRQPVTYIIVRCGDQILRYTRGSYSSAASFLKGRACIGFGGHIERRDREDLFSQADGGLGRGLRRELSEELRLEPQDLDNSTLAYKGVISDLSSEVGKLHVGVVYELNLPDRPWEASDLRRERSINQLEFVPISELGSDFELYEYWSKLCIRHVFPSVRVACKVRTRRGFRLGRNSEVVVVTGQVGSGKTEASRILKDEFGYEEINSGRVLQQIMGSPPLAEIGRAEFQRRAADFINAPDGPLRLGNALAESLESGTRYVIDGLRHVETFNAMRASLRHRPTLLYVESIVEDSYRFYRTRERDGDREHSMEEYLQLLAHPVEEHIPEFGEIANVIVHNLAGLENYRIELRKYFKEEVGS